MSKFKLTKTGIEGLVIIEPTIIGDSRGYFLETYNKRDFEEIGLTMDFVQDNQSTSTKGVLRGMHRQVAHPQGKLVRVLNGTVFDAAVDARKDSPTYGQWRGLLLSGHNHKMFYIPEGFYHGFLVLSSKADFAYKCTDFYYPGDEDGIIWNDPDVDIKWPVASVPEVILSEKDKKLKAFNDA